MSIQTHTSEIHMPGENWNFLIIIMSNMYIGHMTFSGLSYTFSVEDNYIEQGNFALSSTENVYDGLGNVMCPTCWT